MYNDEFPNLHPLGLYASNITGDGNCLFNALSDQLFGNQAQHSSIRSTVVQHMRENKDDYTPFLDVLPGGATRRNPKRKNAATFSSQSDLEMPTLEDIDRAFEDRLRRMGQGGTYGDNFEIVAFTRAYNKNVLVFQANERLYFGAPRTADQADTCCIAYHTWEHYSSIRNLDGPHVGLPRVHLKELTVEELSQMKVPATGPINIQQWQIDVVMQSLWFPVDEATAIRLLEASRGNVDDAVSKLIEELESPDRSSSVHSSSVEPQSAVDDENCEGPNKKQDRRMSHHSKFLSRTQQRQEREQYAESLGSTSSLEQLETIAPSTHSAYRRRPYRRVILDDEDEDEDGDTEMVGENDLPSLVDGTTSSESEYSMATSPPKPPLTIRLSLKPPQPSQPDQQRRSSQLTPIPSRSASKAGYQKKRLHAARDMKSLKKQAQKQHAKERRQAATKPQKEPTTLDFSSNGSSQNSVSSGFRLLHV
ncbi:MAG: hypothetical protein Q9159_006353 [Coniocarpon cinnabarinum]